MTSGVQATTFRQYLPHYRDTLRLGLPIVLGQLGIVAVGFLDSIMVGRYATADLAASSFVNSVFNLPLLFGIGFSYGLTPLVGQFFGRGEHARVGELLRDSLWVNGIVGVVLSLIMWLCYANLHRAGQPVELLPLIRPYFLLQTVSLVFLMTFNAFKQFSDGIRDTVTPMWIMLGSNVLNVIGNYILIYGHAGFPPMGLTGAGISTLVARVAALLAFAIAFFYGTAYAPYRHGFFARRRRRSDARTLTRMGLMVGTQMGMETGLFSITGVMVGWLGPIALAAHQVTVTLSMLGFMIYYGFGAAISVRVSNLIGRGSLAEVRRATAAGFHLIMVMASIVAIFFLVSRGWIAYLFTDSPEVVGGVSILMIIMAVYQFGDGLQITYANSLRGISDVVSMAALSFIGYFLVALPLCYLAGFTFGGGLTGVWMGYPVGLTLAGLLFRARYRQRLRRLSRR
ncbi:MAG: MATE family efflux transporter [Odoribacteraceae bacterium]|nr:MATE family efflux transporter [Odoribacteraceae bacterium]